MLNDNSLQLFIGREIDLESLTSKLKHLTGHPIMTLEENISDGVIFLQINRYAEGDFPIGAGLSWRKGMKLGKASWKIVRQVAQELKARVATDLPPALTHGPGPFGWMLAEPTGELYLLLEDKQFSQSGDGLRLDEKSRQPLNFNVLDSNPMDL